MLGPSIDHEENQSSWSVVGQGRLARNTTTQVTLVKPLSIVAGGVCGIYMHTDERDGIKYGEENNGESNEDLELVPGHAAYDTPFARRSDRKFPGILVGLFGSQTVYASRVPKLGRLCLAADPEDDRIARWQGDV
jgi:hypothetical protein